MCCLVGLDLELLERSSTTNQPSFGKGLVQYRPNSTKFSYICHICFNVCVICPVAQASQVDCLHSKLLPITQAPATGQKMQNKL